MTTVDWVIIGIISLSTVMSLWRGATREIFSLATWVLAIYLGVKFASSLDPVLSGLIDTQSVRFAVGFMIIFLVMMILGGLLMRLLSQFITFTGLTLVDRLLGLMFGVARGVLIIAVLIVLAKYSTLPQDDWWKASQLLPHFEGISTSLSNWVQDQGFDPDKLETLIESVDGKPAKPKAVPDAGAENGEVNTILGVPVPDESDKPNMLGGQPSNDGNAN